MRWPPVKRCAMRVNRLFEIQSWAKQIRGSEEIGITLDVMLKLSPLRESCASFFFATTQGPCRHTVHAGVLGAEA